MNPFFKAFGELVKKGRNKTVTEINRPSGTREIVLKSSFPYFRWNPCWFLVRWVVLARYRALRRTKFPDVSEINVTYWHAPYGDLTNAITVKTTLFVGPGFKAPDEGSGSSITEVTTIDRGGRTNTTIEEFWYWDSLSSL